MWEKLYENYYKELVKYGIRLCGSKELTEDLIQETFVKALMNAETVADLSPKKQRAWLYRTFKNLFFDRYRHTIIENKYIETFHPDGVEKQWIQDIENIMLLQSLTSNDKMIFQLRYFYGYTTEEISKMMNLPPGTIRSKLSRCRKYLKQNFEL